MEKIKHKKKKTRPIDIPIIIKMIEDAGVSYSMIERHCKIGKGIIGRGLKEGTPRPIPQKWELPIIKYLKKKISEKVDIELQTEEVKLEMGYTLPEKQSNLKEEIKENKKKWLLKLQTT